MSAGSFGPGCILLVCRSSSESSCRPARFHMRNATEPRWLTTKPSSSASSRFARGSNWPGFPPASIVTFPNVVRSWPAFDETYTVRPSAPKAPSNCGGRVRGEPDLSAAVERDAVEVVVAAARDALHERVLAVAADVGDDSDAGVLRDEPRGSARGVDQVRVHRGAIAAVRGDGDRLSVGRPRRKPVVDLAALGELAHPGAVGAHDGDLRVQAA